MSTNRSPRLSPEEYLEIERQAERKSEYYAGEMFAMPGAPATHNILAANFLGILHGEFRRRNCLVFQSDMRVHVPATGLYTYPDVSAVCGDPVYIDNRRDTLLNPTVIVEVLSPSTESYDRGRKFEHYRTVPSLLHYVLVATDRVSVDLYTRESDGRWVLGPLEYPESIVDLSAIGVHLAVRDLYEKTGLIAPVS
jgi:Uma2 family endonuclease